MPTPTPGANSYGSLSGVAALVRMYARDNGAFTANTNPTDQNVVDWIDQLSESMNAALGAYGFATPVSNARAVTVLTGIIQQLAADLVQYANNSGRFFTERAQNSNVSVWATIENDILNWAKLRASGLEAIGAARTVSANEYAVGHLGSGPQGQSIFPIFQRDSFGNSFQDWENQQNTNTDTDLGRQ